MVKCYVDKLNQSQLDLSDSNDRTKSNLTVAHVPEADGGNFLINCADT